MKSLKILALIFLGSTPAISQNFTFGETYSGSDQFIAVESYNPNRSYEGEFACINCYPAGGTPSSFPSFPQNCVYLENRIVCPSEDLVIEYFRRNEAFIHVGTFDSTHSYEGNYACINCYPPGGEPPAFPIFPEGCVYVGGRIMCPAKNISTIQPALSLQDFYNEN